ncbi:DUF975 family protein [Clostridium saccharobutylicum]|uniref:Glycerophosphoryl diester phosphodiesterase membrane domain-containing protein n=1 Tax=Clostridium saccharobutylicum TaxID=169679 RepID=A0A1S8NDN6_CLOSA|nr:DUF975 family protein [Clostridium saccharobutylicum]OOM14381.1 hypothetical protein CLOSAC_12540 [Clostridium saccharobutylicum]
MNTRAELKSHAKNQLKGKWGLAVGGFFVAGILIPIIVNFISRLVSHSVVLSIIMCLISIIIDVTIGVGLCRFSLNYADENKEPEFADIFSGFKIVLKAIGLYILMMIIVMIGLIVFIVPGIILIYMFSQSFFILADDNSKSIIECLKESANMMKGHKIEYFILLLSFLGWIILGIIPLCIGLLWVIPYMNVTIANYYFDVKEKYNQSRVS